MAGDELSLREFLAGHLLRDGMLRFEDAMGPWVKAKAAAHFGTTPEEEAAVRDHAARVVAHTVESAEIVAKQANLKATLAQCASHEKQAVVKQQATLKKRLGKLAADLPGEPPTPLWIGEIRHFLGQRTKKHVTAGSRWDIHTITAVLRALPPEVFAAGLPSGFHAKAVLSALLSVLTARTSRAHREVLSESDVLEALLHMHAVLQQMRPGQLETTQVGKLLRQAKH